ncbi:MAG: helix-turn-helix domain-containing protein [Candidatus Omnitrophota bacterium]
MAENKNEKTVGIILKETRVARKISLEEVSRHTKIHMNILKMIEADEFKSLGAVYSKSFLKLYAEYLNLDRDALIRRFESEQKLDVFSGGKKLKIPEEQQIGGMVQFPLEWVKKTGALLKNLNMKYVIIIILCLLSIIGIRKFIKGMKSSKKSVVVAQALDQKASEKKETRVVSKKDDTSAKKNTNEKIVLIIRAKQKCWLQVKVDGKIVFQSILTDGAAESWQAKEKIELWLGNAGGVELELNGKLLEKIGRPGQTLKNVVVTRDGLSIQK